MFAKVQNAELRQIQRLGSAAIAVGLSAAVCVSAHAQDQPVLKDGRLIFPEDGAIPRSLTPVEREYIKHSPLALLVEATPPPTGPVRAPAEYDPMDGVLLSYRGLSSWKTILDQMAAHITTTGDADIIAIVPFSSNVSEAIQRMTNAGADMDRVNVLVQPTDSIWIRDYGPRYVYEGDIRVAVDHTYNRPRPLDDAIPEFLSNHFNHGYYKMPLVHGGGNYHLDALTTDIDPGGGYTTELINNENPDLNHQEIGDIFYDYWNLETTFYDVFPSYVDATGHIDMWMQVIADDRVIISTWPANPSSTQQQICDAAAADFESRGFTVYRTPARLISGTHYTYTNMVVVNDLVLLPSFTHSTMAPHNAEAMAIVESAVPDKTVVPINTQAIVTSAGVLHCIMMHVPAYLGGENPTAYLRNLRGGEVLEPGEIIEIEWISDGITIVFAADILLSLDDGETFDITLVEQTPNTGSWEWTVPDLQSTNARLRVVVHDRNGATGYDESPESFTIGDEAMPDVPGDLNGDGVVNVDDLLILLNAWGECAECQNVLGDCNDCDDCIADITGDCTVNVDDLLILLNNWGS